MQTADQACKCLSSIPWEASPLCLHSPHCPPFIPPLLQCLCSQVAQRRDQQQRQEAHSSRSTALLAKWRPYTGATPSGHTASGGNGQQLFSGTLGKIRARCAAKKRRWSGIASLGEPGVVALHVFGKAGHGRPCSAKLAPHTPCSSLLYALRASHRGVVSAATGAGIIIGAYFAFYSTTKRFLRQRTRMSDGQVAFVSGGVAAIGSGVVKVPIAVCIRSVQAGVYPNVVVAARSITGAAGVQGLFTVSRAAGVDRVARATVGGPRLLVPPRVLMPLLSRINSRSYIIGP